MIPIFRKIRKQVAFTGKKLEDVATAIVYLLLRIDGRPFTLFDFKRIGCKTQRINRYYKQFIKSFDLSKFIKRQDVKSFVIKVVNSLLPDEKESYHLKHKIILFTYKLYTGLFVQAIEHPVIDITYHKGAGLPAVGAIIYAACKLLEEFKITQKTVAEACGCSEVTLRDYLDQIKQHYKEYES